MAKDRTNYKASTTDISLRQYVETLLNTLRSDYDNRFRAAEIAVSAALAAQEKAVAAAFLASEKAIIKAEDAQKEYNQRSNEFRGQLDDQAKLLMQRTEALGLFAGLNDKAETLRASFDNRLETMRIALEKAIEINGVAISEQRAEMAKYTTNDEHNFVVGRVSTLETSQANLAGRLWAIGVIVPVIITMLSIGVSVALHYIH